MVPEEGLTDEQLLELETSSSEGLTDAQISQLESNNTSKNSEFPSAMERIFSVPSAANRSFLMGKGYAEGASNFRDVPTFQDTFLKATNEALSKTAIRNLPEGIQERILMSAGMGPSAVGFALDSITNPAEALTGMAVGGASKLAPVAKVLSKEVNFGKRLVKPAVKNIEEMILQSAKEASEASKTINLSRQVEVAKARGDFSAAKKILKDRADFIENNDIPIAADKATFQARKSYFQIAKDISNRFGKDYKAAINGQKVDTESLNSAIEDVIDESGLLNKPQERWSEAEKAIVKFRDRIASKVPATRQVEQVIMTSQGPQRVQVPTGSPTLDLEAVDNDLQNILRVFSDKKYSSGEHILTMTREKIADLLGNSAKSLKDVRMKYAPELQMKNEAYKIFQPFNRSGQYDTTKGIEFFRRYANGKSNPDEIRLINELGKRSQGMLDEINLISNSKRDLARQMNKLVSEQPERFNSIKSSHLEAKRKLDQETASHIELLKGMKEVAQSEEEVGKRIMAAVGLGALEESTIGIGRKIFKSISGKL